MKIAHLAIVKLSPRRYVVVETHSHYHLYEQGEKEFYICAGLKVTFGPASMDDCEKYVLEHKEDTRVVKFSPVTLE